MPFDSAVLRAGAQALMPEDVAKEIIQGTVENSAVMKMGVKAPNMSRKQRRVPVLSTLPTAYFVDGDVGLKQTSEQAWGNKYFNAEELAVIIPIPEAVLADADYDIWEQIRPRIVEAFGVAFDAAAMFGVNAPASWPTAIVTDALAKGKSVALGTGDDLYDDLLGESGVISMVEESGFMVTGHMAAMNMRGKYRGLRDANGVPLFMNSIQSKGQYELDGSPIEFPRNGAFNPAVALQVSGDFKQLVYAMRQDITLKLLTEAVIQDNTGAIVYNLAQQDMVALRAVMRLAWQVPNPINRLDGTVNRYPFAVLTPAIV